MTTTTTRNRDKAVLTAKTFKSELQGEVVYVDPDTLVINPKNERIMTARSNIRALAELESSIKDQGVRQPILVYKESNIVADGNRRCRAAQNVKTTKKELKVPVIYVTEPENEALRILSRLTYNNLSKPFSQIETGLAVKRLKEEGWTNAQITKHVGVQQAHLYNLLAIADAPDWLQELVMDEVIGVAPAMGIYNKTKDWGQTRAIIEHAKTVAEKEAFEKSPTLQIDGDDTAVRIMTRHLVKSYDAHNKPVTATPSASGSVSQQQTEPMSEPPVTPAGDIALPVAPPVDDAAPMVDDVAPPAAPPVDDVAPPAAPPVDDAAPPAAPPVDDAAPPADMAPPGAPTGATANGVQEQRRQLTAPKAEIVIRAVDEATAKRTETLIDDLIKVQGHLAQKADTDDRYAEIKDFVDRLWVIAEFLSRAKISN